MPSCAYCKLIDDNYVDPTRELNLQPDDYEKVHQHTKIVKHAPTPLFVKEEKKNVGVIYKRLLVSRSRLVFVLKDFQPGVDLKESLVALFALVA